jgi:hypothetical protein
LILPLVSLLKSCGELDIEPYNHSRREKRIGLVNHLAGENIRGERVEPYNHSRREKRIGLVNHLAGENIRGERVEP